MNLPDSFYIALCMTILLLGAVYWVWTQIQFVQRKVNVLENIVYELKTVCTAGRPPDGPVSSYPPAPPSVLGEDEDLLHQTLAAEVSAGPTMQIGTLDDVLEDEVVLDEERVQPMPDEDVPADAQEAQGATDAPDAPDVQPVFDMTQLFNMPPANTDAPVSDDLQPGGVGSGVVTPPLANSLKGMTTKQLRQLAQQKGISGANEMSKRDLIDAIRAVPIESFLE